MTTQDPNELVKLVSELAIARERRKKLRTIWLAEEIVNCIEGTLAELDTLRRPSLSEDEVEPW